MCLAQSDLVAMNPSAVAATTAGDVGTAAEAGTSDTVDTILRYLEENNKKPDDFDMIITGDLGSEGLSILGELLTVSGLDVSREGLLEDCGRLIYDTSAQDVHAGGSGCGCSAVTLAAHLLPRLQKGSLRDILFIGTGAMMSPSSTKQGEAIPAVAHLVHLCSPTADKR